MIGGHTTCAHCGHGFRAPAEQAGSLQNCPDCGKATKIEGENDPLWALVQLLSIGAVIAAAAVVHLTHGQPAALGTLAGGAALLLVARQVL